MAVQLASTMGATYIHNVKKLLDVAKFKMPLKQFSQIKTIPLHSGYSAKFTRMMHLAPVTQSLSASPGEGTPVTYATLISPYAQEITVSVAPWGNSIGVSDLLNDTFINDLSTSFMEILGMNAGESMNLEHQKTLAAATTTDDVAGMIAYVYDANATATNNCRGTATTTGSTTTLVDTGLATQYNANDHVNGGWITFTNPQERNYGLARKVLDFVSTTGVVSWTTAVNVATTTATTYRIGCFYHDASTLSTLTAGTDVMCMAAINNATTILNLENTPTFNDGYFRMTCDPYAEAALRNDTDAVIGYTAVHKYVDQGNLLDGEIGRAGGVRIVKETKPYRITEAAGYAYGVAGTIYCNFILGKDALGICGLSGLTDTQYKIKHPGPTTTSDPNDMVHTASWKTNFGRLALNATSCVGIITMPTLM